MVYILFTAFLSALAVNAQITSPPSPPAPSFTPPIAGATEPLTDYTFTYPNLPEQVNPFPSGRGPQFGYNICNATTEGPTSLCQTMFLNSIKDFCLWGSPDQSGVIGNVEAKVVAYCSNPGHGTRVMPPGTLTAVQFIKTPGYIQVTGLINQMGIGLDPTDGGGELDPHGADLAGNPLGGLVFSNNLPTSTDNTTYVQVNNWSNFVGGGQFCFKACDNTIRSPNYCQNIYDTQGCAFNMPAAYAPNVFLSCLGDNQVPPGAAPVIPATSSCTTYTSSLLYPNSATTSATTTAAGKSPTQKAGSSSTGASSSSASVFALPSFGAILGVAVAVFAGMAVVF